MLVSDGAFPDLVHMQGSHWDDHVAIGLHAFVEAIFTPGWTKSLVNSIFMGSPHVFNSLFDFFTASLSGHEGWCNEPKKDILGL